MINSGHCSADLGDNCENANEPQDYGPIMITTVPLRK